MFYFNFKFKAHSGFGARRHGQCARFALEAELLLELSLLFQKALDFPTQFVHLLLSFCDSGYESCATDTVGEIHPKISYNVCVQVRSGLLQSTNNRQSNYT